MEDTHTLRLSLSKGHPELSFFGVYDGHAGDKASIYLADQLVESVATLSDPTNPALLSDRLIECDNEFLKRYAYPSFITHSLI
jgi:serine/threonine protein phosphatase PrpC